MATDVFSYFPTEYSGAVGTDGTGKIPRVLIRKKNPNFSIGSDGRTEKPAKNGKIIRKNIPPALSFHAG